MSACWKKPYTHRKPRKLPYGATRGKYWCHCCDAALVPEWKGSKPKNIKKRERQRAKREIKNETR